MKRIRIVLFLIVCFGLFQGLNAQCGAAYLTSDDTVVCVPKIVRFKVHKFPAGTNFGWDLGSGYVSSDSTFTKLYSSSGNFNVRVKLTYLDGSTCVFDNKNIVQAKPIPIPKYTITRNVLCKYNDSFVLTDITNKTVQRDWLFDNTLYQNGPKSLKASFSKPYGYKSFTMFMKDSFGCEGRKSFDSAAYVADSISVDFDANLFSGCTPKKLIFYNKTDTLGQKISSWNWSFPGASPSTSNLYEPYNITYNTKDTFDVQLTITTKRGCTYSKIEKQFLTFADSALISANFSNSILCASERLKVDLIGTRSKDPLISGSPQSFTETRVSSTNYKYKFTKIGTYSFYISDNYNGCMSEKTYTNNSQVNGPVADFKIPFNYSCLMPDTFKVFDSSFINSGQTKTLKWDLYRDSFPNTSIQTGTGSPMDFNCNKYGGYSVRLIVTGSNSCADTLTVPGAIQIKRILPQFVWSPKSTCPSESVLFEDLTPRGTSKAINRIQWTFYNKNNSVLRRDTIRKPKIIFPDTGRYSVKLLIFNNLGCKDSILIPKKVIISNPAPKFNVYDSNVCYGKPIKIRAIYTDSNYYNSYIHIWIFQHTDSSSINYRFGGYNGDSINAYLLPGKYNVTCTRYSNRNTCFDTFSLKVKIRVSGIRVDVITNPIKICNPDVTKLIAKFKNSYNFANNNIDPLSFRWSHFYDTGMVSISNRTINPATALVKKAGRFSFKFTYKHSSGCNDSFITGALTSGIYAYFSGDKACVGKILDLNNLSDKDAVRYKWFMKDSGSGATFLPTDTSKNAKIVFKKEGVYKAGLITYGNGKCTDTFLNQFSVLNIKASFSSNDTINYCAPIIARVTAKTNPYILNYKWYIGPDSIADNVSNVAYLFQKNTGPIGADVRLVVTSYVCKDTMDKKAYLKVIGPIPKFTLGNNVGCETLRVKFNNQSKYYNRFFLEYGDGSTLDSINFNTHDYKIYDPSLPKQTFRPVLSVIDSFSCLVQYTNDTILVQRSPESKFTVNQDTGCSRLDVTFRNISLGGLSFKWDFDGNGTIDNATFGPRHSYPAGEYNPVLITTATNGCQDTVNNLVFIKSYARPDARFTTNVDTVCYNGKIQFNGSNRPFNSDIKSWLWDFGDPYSIKDSSTTQNPSYSFKKIALSQVILQVTDKNNCTDTFDRFIYVYDTIGPVSNPMNFVSVSNSKDIDISWSKSTVKSFDSYNLFNDNSNNYTLLFNSSNLNDTNYRVLQSSGINVNTSRYCYVIKTKDICKNLGVVSFPHCTIYLEINNDSTNVLELNWLSYEGWGAGKVSKYRIYRRVNNGPFTLYDSTSNSNLNYKDKKLCTNTYCYYVEAVYIKGPWTSKSNIVCKMPIYKAPTQIVNSIRTTVLPGNLTYTHWDKYNFIKDVDHYIVSKEYVGSSGIDYYALTDTIGFIDRDPFLETDKSSYTYKIRAVDHCGAESPEGTENTTVLLKGKSEGYVAKLQWTEYKKWFSGVKQYNVLLRENSTFKVVGSIGSSSSNYSFDFTDTKLDDSICFKIQAIKDTNQFVESFSNMLCLISEAKIFVPNAFTPNKDGKNEVFIPRAILIFNQTGNPILDYKFEIYNRWGEQVFESNDLNVGWDGTYKGQLCQEGHYVYKVRALSLDGSTAFNLEGVLVLLR
jgi:gliding motility-associated-like protein